MGGCLGIVLGPLCKGAGCEQGPEESGRVTAGVTCNEFGRTLGDQFATGGAGLRTEVENPVGRLDHLEVMLDDNHGIAQIGQAVNHLQQFLDIIEVESGCGLIQDVERLSRVRAGQLGGQLDALSLAAG